MCTRLASPRASVDSPLSTWHFTSPVLGRQAYTTAEVGLYVSLSLHTCMAYALPTDLPIQPETQFLKLDFHSCIVQIYGYTSITVNLHL